MKMLLVLLIVTGISITFTVVSAAAKKDEPANIGQEQSTQEQLLETVSYSGLVVEGEDGLRLETDAGSYQLRGLNLQELLNQNVIITGILKGEEENSTLFVVKVDKQS